MINGREKLGRYLKRILAVALAVTVISPASLSNVAQAAAKTPTLSITKTTNVLIGEKLTVSVKNKISGSKYAWSSSNKKIAKVNSKGVVTAVKAGNATITCKVTAPKKTYTLKGKVKVVDRVVVATQAQLNKALKKTNLSRITIKTNKAVNFTIPAGTYSRTLLLVDAPKSDVTNSARFNKIVIDQIKGDTFTEKGKGNTFNLRAPYTNLVISKGAEVNNISLRGKETNIVVDGDITGRITYIKGTNVTSNPSLTLSGETKKPVEVRINNEGAKLVTSVKTEVTVNAKSSTLTFEKGAEGSKVEASNENVVPTVDNKTSEKIDVIVDKKPETPSTGDGGGGGGGGTVTPSDPGASATVKVEGKKATYKLPKNLSNISTITVQVTTGTITANYTITGDTLGYLKGLLTRDDDIITKWNNASYDIPLKEDNRMKVEFGKADNGKREVTFTDKTINVSLTFEVKLLEDNKVEVKSQLSTVVYTLSNPSADVLEIETSESAMDSNKVKFTNIK